MTLLVQVTKAKVCAGGIVRNDRLTIAAPYLWQLTAGIPWSAMRDWLLKHGYSVWEKKL